MTAGPGQGAQAVLKNRTIRWEVAKAAWRGVSRFAHDITTDLRDRSAVVLAPHADDETLGCGGTIALKTRAGAAVTIVIATDGRRSSRPLGTTEQDTVTVRREEAALAAAALGAAPPVHLPFADGGLHRTPDDLDRAIAEHLRAAAPDDVFSPSPHDPHPDHAALGAAVRRVLSSFDGGAPQLLEYAIWQRVSIQAAVRALADWRRFASVDVTATQEAKRAAFACYVSQTADDVEMTGPPLPRRFTETFFGGQELFTRVTL